MSGEVSHETLASLRQGDENALTAVMKAYGLSVFRRALDLLGNREDAEEAAQETLWRLYCKAHKVEDTEHLLPWLQRVTTNICIDTLRQRRLQTVELEEARNATVQDFTEDATTRLEVVALLDAMDPVNRRIVLMRAAGCTNEEIARVLQVSKATVIDRRHSVKNGKLKPAKTRQLWWEQALAVLAERDYLTVHEVAGRLSIAQKQTTDALTTLRKKGLAKPVIGEGGYRWVLTTEARTHQAV